jgi:flagellin
MSSILTNNSAMSALQTLKSIHSNLDTVTSQVSTGKRVAEARDNPAIWAVSKVISTDIDSFKTISDNLGFGLATVGVAANAAQTVVDNLAEIKSKIIAAQSSNVDRSKLQADVAALRENIISVVKGAQFNGLNLINGTTASTSVLASLDRSGASVTANNIIVTGQNLSVGAYIKRTVLTGSDGVSNGADVAGFALNSGTVAAPGTGKLVIQQGAVAPNKFVAGDSVSVTIAGKTASYTVAAADTSATSNTNEIVAIGLKSAIEALGITGLSIDYDYTGNLANLTFKNTNGAVGTDYRVAAQFSNVGSGGLGALAALDVSTAGAAAAALSSIDTLISTSVSAASSFATTQVKIDSQQTFVNSLADSMKTGIGTLIDTDMEEASARLQALQVQQQLSTQALSIANQQSQGLLSLFR